MCFSRAQSRIEVQIAPDWLSKATRPGVGLGVSTGWILRSSLAKREVKSLVGVVYERIDDRGLHILLEGKSRILDADTIVICAGQEANRAVSDPSVAPRPLIAGRRR